MAGRYDKCVHNDGWTFHPNPPQLSRIHPNLTGSYTVVGATLVVARVFRYGDRRVLEGRAPTRDAPTIVNFRGIRRVLRLSFSYDGRETLEHFSTGFTHVQPSHRRGNLVVARFSVAATVASWKAGCPYNCKFRGIRRVLRSFSYDGRETLEHLSTGFTHIRP